MREDQERFEAIVTGHTAFQYLFAGTELGIFEFLAEAELSQDRLQELSGLSERCARLLCNGLVALKLIEKNGDSFRSSGFVKTLMNDGRWETMKRWIIFEGKIVYPGQRYFLESLVQDSNVGLRALPGSGKTLYERFKSDDDLSDCFFGFMSSWSEMASTMIVDNIQLATGSRLLDVGGGDGTIALGICAHFPTIEVSVMDLPHVCKEASRHLDKAVTEEEIPPDIRRRVVFYSRDFFKEEWPSQAYDYILFAHQLLIWSENHCLELLRRAFETLEPGGEIIIISSMMNESGTEPLPSVMRSAYFLSIPSGEGEVYRWTDYTKWLQKIGFSDTRKVETNAWTPHGIIVGKKPDYRQVTSPQRTANA